MVIKKAPGLPSGNLRSRPALPVNPSVQGVEPDRPGWVPPPPLAGCVTFGKLLNRALPLILAGKGG